MATQYQPTKRNLSSTWAYAVWLIMSITVWLSFVACLWLAVWYQEWHWAAFGVWWFVWMVILWAVPGTEKRGR